MSSPLGVSCSVCFSSLCIDNAVCLDVCGHTYHEDCIKRWFIHSNTDCPVCRKLCRPCNILKLFFRPSIETQDDSMPDNTDSEDVYTPYSVESVFEGLTAQLAELRQNVAEHDSHLREFNSFLAETRATTADLRRRIDQIAEAESNEPVNPAPAPAPAPAPTPAPAPAPTPAPAEPSYNLDIYGAAAWLSTLSRGLELPFTHRPRTRPVENNSASDWATSSDVTSERFPSESRTSEYTYRQDPRMSVLQNESSVRTTPNDAEVFRESTGTSFLPSVYLTPVPPVAMEATNSSSHVASHRLWSATDVNMTYSAPQSSAGTLWSYYGTATLDDDNNVVVLE